MNVSFHGLRDTVATFEGAAGALVPVKMSDSGKIIPAADGNVFCGITTAKGNEFVPVQLAGFVSAAYSGTAPTVGYVKLAADAAGGVKVNASGREYLVVEVNTDKKTVGFLLA